MVFKLFKKGIEKVQSALSKTRSVLGQGLKNLFNRGKLDDKALEDLEQLLYEADLGVQTAADLTEKIRTFQEQNPKADEQALLGILSSELLAILTAGGDPSLAAIPQPDGPTVIMIVGVNGNGKTTSIAKICHRLQNEGKKVVLGAADTFRAAAMDQLESWARKLDVDIVRGHAKSDPAAVVFDTVSAAKARNADAAIIDTAGRLQTKTSLMQELEKMRRSCHKILPNAPHETLLVIDASIGQNAIDQAKTFHQYTPITGLILTKLDGTAKGGIVVPITQELHIPIKFIGTGEQLDDLEPFNAKKFVQALFE